MKIEISNERLRDLFEEFCTGVWDALDIETKAELGVRYPAEPDVGRMVDYYVLDGREEQFYEWCAQDSGYVDCFLNNFWDDEWLKQKDLFAISLLDDADREEVVFSIGQRLKDWGK